MKEEYVGTNVKNVEQAEVRVTTFQGTKRIEIIEERNTFTSDNTKPFF